MNLVKTSILSIISTTVKILSRLVISKAMAVYIGPAGLAVVGQFQNFSQLAMTVARGAINSGVTKYTAQYGPNSERLPMLFSTASKISLSCSVIVGAVIVLISNYASIKFLKNEEYSYIFVIFGFTIVLFVINNLLLSIINGLKEIKTFISINIIQSLFSLLFTTLLIVILGLDGALIAMVTNQSVIFLVVLCFLRKHDVIKFSNFVGSFDRREARKLAGFAMMAITSAVIVPISQMIIRNHLGETLGWDEAGYWQAIWFISNTYLMVATTALSIYYLPKLSELTDKHALRRELLNGYTIIMPIVIASSLLVFLLKDFIIWMLFSKEFAPMAALFKWQLIGSVFKMAAWLLSYLLLAKAMTIAYIWTEIVFSLSFIGWTFLFVKHFGLPGVTHAFALNYLLYGIVIFFIVKKELF